MSKVRSIFLTINMDVSETKMKIAFLIQNLAHKSDSIGYDCIFEYRALKKSYGEGADIYVFADVYDQTLHSDVLINSFSGFLDFYEKNQDAIVVYHFCDGWYNVDDYLVENVKNLVVRWHNNTPPWFYVLNHTEFAEGALNGFDIISRLAKSDRPHFFVNSEFSKRQLKVLGGFESKISTVFPASNFLKKRHFAAPKGLKIKQDQNPIKLLFVGRVVPHKGHKHIISVASALQRYTLRKVEVTFVGGLEERLKPYWVGLEATARQLDIALVMTGLVSDEQVMNLYFDSDVFICLSEHEGFGLPVFEAMRCQVPVVAWATSAIYDLLSGHPLACRDFSIARFAAAVLVAIDPQNRSKIIEIQNQILLSYTEEVVVSQLMQAVSVLSGSMRHENHPTQKQLLVDDEILSLVEKKGYEIESKIGHSIKTFTHDAQINYVCEYDISVYKRLIKLLKSQARPMTYGHGKKEELHRHFSKIKKIFEGEDAVPLFKDAKLDDFLSFNDDIFLIVIFAVLLNRSPDEGGFVYYLAKLRNGYSKTKIISEILSSSEAVSSGVTVQGIHPEDSFEKNGLAENASALTRIEELVSRISRYLIPFLGKVPAYHPMGSIRHVRDLLSLDDKNFVDNAYLSLMGRHGDEGGVAYWMSRLNEGTSRADLLREFVKTDDAQSRIHFVDGLEAFLSGYDEVSFIEDVNKKRPSSTLMRIENELGRTIQLLAGHEPFIEAFGELEEESEKKKLLRLSTEESLEIDIENNVLCRIDSTSSSVNNSKVEYIHQILINDDDNIPEKFPDIVQNNIDSVRFFYKSAKYKLWTKDDIRAFIEKNFSPDVLEAFDGIQPYAYKADLARYCLLYVFGGLYTDLSNRFFGPISLAKNTKIMVFREHKPLHGSFWMVQNSIIYAEPRLPEIKLAIDLVVENVRKRDYGVSSLAPSGPVLFGRVFAALGRKELYQIGQCINLQVEGSLNRSCYIDAGGKLISIRLQGGGGKPSELGLRGTNVYGEMWEKRIVYGEGLMRYRYDNPALKISGKVVSGGVQASLDREGLFLHGPHVNLPPGVYTAVMKFLPKKDIGSLSLNVFLGSDSEIIKDISDLKLDSRGLVQIDFSLKKSENILDIKLYVNENFNGVFSELTIFKKNVADFGIHTHDSNAASDEQALNVGALNLIHQIDLDGSCDDFIENEKILKKIYPRSKYLLWSIERIDTFIKKNFSTNTLEAFRSIHSAECKSQMARYCLLYKLGGMYIDRSIRFVLPLSEFELKDITCFRSGNVGEGFSWGVDTGLIFARPKQPEIFDVINFIVDEIKSGKPIVTTSDILGQTLAKNYRANRYGGGEVVGITKGYKYTNDIFLSFSGQVIAARLPVLVSEI